VVGAAALTAGPTDEEGLAMHCLNLLAEPALARSLRELGLARVGRFSNEAMFRALEEVYTEAAAVGLEEVPA